MEALFDNLARLDWFEHVDALIKAFTDGPSVKFAISRNAGWSGQAVEEMLKSHGAKLWHRGFTRDALTFRVKVKQARWCKYLLAQHGIPVLREG